MTSNEDIVGALDTLRSGVYVVTSSYRKKPAGCTCVWICRVSFEPPLVGVSLARGRHTLETIEAGRRFCINVMGESGLRLARRFGFPAEPGDDRFRGVEYARSKSGSPILEAAVSFIDCHLHGVIPIGDHRLVLGKIIDAQVRSQERPMLYDPQAFYTIPQQRGAVSHA
jgi:3-hydroxy-9,10-secoandrosta-1,3,5(10)-triene-9,17-dione monooxygenase reductase component